MARPCNFFASHSHVIDTFVYLIFAAFCVLPVLAACVPFPARSGSAAFGVWSVMNFDVQYRIPMVAGFLANGIMKTPHGSDERGLA